MFIQLNHLSLLQQKNRNYEPRRLHYRNTRPFKSCKPRRNRTVKRVGRATGMECESISEKRKNAPTTKKNRFIRGMYKDFWKFNIRTANREKRNFEPIFKIIMKAGYSITRLEHCTPPKCIEVINYHFSNEVYNVFWFNYIFCNRDTNSIGVWKIKQLKN